MAISVQVLVTALVLAAGAHRACALDPPEFHVDVAVEGKKYYRDGDLERGGYELDVDGFSIRFAGIEAFGCVGEGIEYSFEAATATCQPGRQIKLMEAGVFYRPSTLLRLGFAKGHMLRGFMAHECCIHMLTAEKPGFRQVFARCHPTGAVLDFDYSANDAVRIEAQLAYLNGPAGTLDREHDFLFGLVLHTPVPGLSVCGHYSDVAMALGAEPIPPYETVYGSGYRTGFGVSLDSHNSKLRGEYYHGKAFQHDDPQESVIRPEDLEMTAFYFEGGYAISTGWDALRYVQPYAKYESWDKASNVDGDHRYSYLTGGVTLGLSEEQSMLRIDYMAPVSQPGGADDEAERLIVRLQTAL